MGKMKKQKGASPNNNNKKGAVGQAKKLQKNVGAPANNAIKKKKMAKIANKKTKALLGDTPPVVKNDDNVVKKSGLTKNQQRRLRLKKAKAIRAENLTKGTAVVGGVKRKQTDQPKKGGSKKIKEAENETSYKAFLTGLPRSSSDSDVRTALIGAGAKQIENVQVVKSRRGASCTVSFKDEKSLNEVLKLNGTVKVSDKVIQITLYKKKEINAPAAKGKTVGKKNKKASKSKAEEKVESREQDEDESGDDDDDDDDDDEEDGDEDDNEDEGSDDDEDGDDDEGSDDDNA